MATRHTRPSALGQLPYPRAWPPWRCFRPVGGLSNRTRPPSVPVRPTAGGPRGHGYEAVLGRSRTLPRMPGRRVPEGPPPAPVVQRLRLRYAKRGRLRFSSTRDFQRALERALRRADVPMAFSAGFHPHPRISYANAAPTGTASEAEYVELGVSERVDPEAVRVALDDALPAGLDILEVVEAGPGSLADRLEASDWVHRRTPGGPRDPPGGGRCLPRRGPGRGDPNVQDRTPDLRHPGGRSGHARGRRRRA